MSDIVTTTRNSLVPTNISDAMRLAEFMSRARTLPRHLWDSPGDCLMVVELAMRWGMSPFAVAQGISIIQGKQMVEGKLVAAAVEASGAIVGHLDYTFAGEGEARTITVSATRRGETNPRTVDVALKDARTANEMWKRQPDQQLVYHGARVWARRWTPAVILGVYSREEMGQVIEGEVVSDEAEAPSPPPDGARVMASLRAAAAPTPRPERKVAPKTDAYAPNNLQSELSRVLPPDQLAGVEAWLAGFQVKLDRCQTRAELDLVVTRPAVTHNLENGPAAMQSEMNAMIAAAYDRLPAVPRETPEDLDDDVHIIGEDKVMAGD